MRSLRFVPLIAAALVLAPATASAYEDDYDPDYDSSSSRKAEAGVAIEAYRSGPSLFGGPGVTGAQLGFHGRLGRRIALGLGVEQAYGDDPSGLRRYDIAWQLPKLYVYFNPKSKTQLYATTGMDMRVSHFDDGPGMTVPGGTPWGFFYMGTYFGGGVEHRMEKSWALRLEARWFVRGRVDGRKPEGTPTLDPAFSDATRGYKGGVISLGFVFF